jgi:anti-anti-sigma factor
MAAELHEPEGFSVASGLLQITVTDEAEHLVIAPCGDIDVSTAPLFADCLVTAANQAAQPVIVDLTGVTFMDSAGLDALIVGHRLLRSSGVPLRVRNSRSTVRQLIEVTGTGPMFDLDG